MIAMKLLFYIFLYEYKTFIFVESQKTFHLNSNIYSVMKELKL